jgi:hypothetical protein
MNYRRKTISMKGRLEEAIEEIGREPLQGSGFERETAEEGFNNIEPATRVLRPRTPKPSVGAHYRDTPHQSGTYVRHVCKVSPGPWSAGCNPGEKMS